LYQWEFTHAKAHHKITRQSQRVDKQSYPHINGRAMKAAKQRTTIGELIEQLLIKQLQIKTNRLFCVPLYSVKIPYSGYLEKKAGNQDLIRSRAFMCSRKTVSSLL
jgi:hypothetical protein